MLLGSVYDTRMVLSSDSSLMLVGSKLSDTIDPRLEGMLADWIWSACRSAVTRNRLRDSALRLMISSKLMLSSPAAAQNSCGPREAVLELLTGQYDEATVAIGLATTGGVIEVLASDDGRTWTIMMTSPDGTSCVVASGEAWIDVIRAAKGQVS